MDARAYGWGCLVVLAGVAMAQWPAHGQFASGTPQQTASAKIDSEWSEFSWPTKGTPPPVDRARQVAGRESARIQDGNAVTLETAEALFTKDADAAQSQLAGRPFAWKGTVAELMTPGGEEALVVFIGPAPRPGWSLHLVFNGPASTLGDVKKGQEVGLTGRFTQRLVDETNFVVSYLIEDAQISSRGPAPTSGTETSGSSAPVIEGGEPRKFSELTKGWRYAGHVHTGDGAIAVFVSPEGKPTFARPGKVIAEGLVLRSLAVDRAVVAVDGKRIVLTPW